MKPYYDHAGIKIFHGDCREIRLAADFPQFHAVISDPPWGTDTAVDSSRFTRKAGDYWSVSDTSKATKHSVVVGDREEFDPRPWILTPCILWGANNFTAHLPHSNGWLIWDKRKGLEENAQNGWPLGECELAWTNVIGATRIFRNRWAGMVRSTEQGEYYHPTQKPIELMEWCIGFLQDKEGVLLDPYMGSGPLLIAAKNKGCRAIGIEIEEKYCEIAAKRLSQEVLDFGQTTHEQTDGRQVPDRDLLVNGDT